MYGTTDDDGTLSRCSYFVAFIPSIAHSTARDADEGEEASKKCSRKTPFSLFQEWYYGVIIIYNVCVCAQASVCVCECINIIKVHARKL